MTITPPTNLGMGRTYYTYRHGPYFVRPDGAHFVVARDGGEQASNWCTQEEAEAIAEVWNTYYAGWLLAKGTKAELELIT